MVFSSLHFLYLFLPLCVLLYFLMPSLKAKNAVLLVFSLVFYAWGEPVYVLLMLGVAAANWAFGLLMERISKKAVLIAALGIANSFVIAFRGMALSAADLFSLGAAASVASEYTFELVWYM